MNRKLIALAAIALLLAQFTATGINKPGSKKSGSPVCYASAEVHAGFVPPPVSFRYRLKSAQAGNATIEVTYSGFTDEARNAFAYAVGIWESLIQSPVTIRMSARFSALGSGILGSCAPTDYLTGFDAEPVASTYYPIALAEKLSGTDLNATTADDISASFNSSLGSWYFGTDGNCPADKYDFVSVVLHEIAHGLGFTGLCYKTSTGLGAYGWNLNNPGIYDRSMINASGSLLTNETLFPNFSASLLNQFQSNFVSYESKSARSAVGSYPRLYAPSTWDDGSSLYHLNENTYLPQNENSLMTPQIGKGEAVHHPGPATLAMLADMGWVTITFNHDQLTDTEDTTSPITVGARVVADAGLDSTSVAVVRSADGFATADTLRLTWSAQTDLFSTQIPVNGAGHIGYYLLATDLQGHTVNYPRTAPASVFDVTIGPDQTAPTLAHSPVKLLLTWDQNLVIEATATDNIGIASVKIEYAPNDGAFSILPLDAAGSAFSKTIALSGLSDGDSVRYRLIATDLSAASLKTSVPTEGYFTVPVEGIYAAVSSYTNTFNRASRDFISTDFYIGTARGFDNGSLNSPHPYASPETADGSYNYTCLLKYPIVLQPGGVMKFDEVVLVEPGETGVDWGSTEFYDYVIAEGSTDGQSNWLPFADGWDSNADAGWLARYNSSLTGNNSTATGLKDLFRSRTIDLTANGNFLAGQTVFIRFRLYSDPFANGWGWAIDNLAVQDIGTDVTNPVAATEGWIFYPNPAAGQLTIEGKLPPSSGWVAISIRNSTGQIVSRNLFASPDSDVKATIDLRSLPQGIYLVSIETATGEPISRKIVHF